MSKKQKITVLRPFDFKNQFVDFSARHQIWSESINDFFIHDLNDRTIKLQLPLPPHKKTVNDFFIVTRGHAKRQVGIHPYEIHPDELLIVPQLQVTTTDFYSDNITGFYCHFSDDFLDNHSLLLDWQLPSIELKKIAVDTDRTVRICQLLTTINLLYQNGWHKNKRLIAQYLRTVILEINFQKAATNPEKNSKQRDITLGFVKLINANLAKRYSIRELAELLNITPNHLNKTIKNQLGKSAQSVYNEILLQEAKVLLLQTSKDVGEIAFDLGFNDISYFGKFFKKQSQKTPLEYRKMIDKYQ